MAKPKIFIGSSVEGLQLAYAIQEILEYDALCTPWTQGVFELSGNTLENLVRAINEFDFAIFILSADDIVKIRDKDFTVVRDNVIFELGLFIGKLGKEKVFFIKPRHVTDLHLPTDLAGIIPGVYDDTITTDLRSALGPFCNKVRRKISEQTGNSKRDNLVEKQSILKNNSEENLGLKGEMDEDSNEFKLVEYGILTDNFGNYQIEVEPSDFFQYRLNKAFPGMRGLNVIEDPKLAVKRLLLLLKLPLVFTLRGQRGISKPIWWFRDGSNMFIEEVRQLSDTRLLINHDELELNRIAIYHSSSEERSFVYVETKGVQQTGLYDIPVELINEYNNEGKDLTEEVALYNGIVIKREEYDDGAAVINGEVTEVTDAELRVRFLTPFNFVITSQTSPINSSDFDRDSKIFFNGILQGTHSIEELKDYTLTLTKSRYNW